MWCRLIHVSQSLILNLTGASNTPRRLTYESLQVIAQVLFSFLCGGAWHVWFWFSATRQWWDLHTKWCTALWPPRSGNAVQDLAALLVRKVSLDRRRVSRHKHTDCKTFHRNKQQNLQEASKFPSSSYSYAEFSIFHCCLKVCTHCVLCTSWVLEQEWFPLSLYKAASCS